MAVDVADERDRAVVCALDLRLVLAEVRRLKGLLPELERLRELLECSRPRD